MKRSAIVLVVLLVLGLAFVAVGTAPVLADTNNNNPAGQCPLAMAKSPGAMSKCPHHQMKPKCPPGQK
ncbi:MAG: hypothetical protein ACE5PM_00620 [Candidatus Hydrothermarchaeales archaeon]